MAASEAAPGDSVSRITRLLARLLRASHAFVITSPTFELTLDAEARARGAVTVASAPVVGADGRVLGGLVAGASTQRAWTEDERATLHELAASLGAEWSLRAENERTQAQLEAIFMHLPLGLAIFDEGLRYERVNAQLAAANGVSREAHVGRRVPELLPDLPSDLEETYRALLASGAALADQRVVGETPARPGEMREWNASFFPVRLPDGRIAGLGAAVVEMTEQRRLERQRAEADALLRDLLENAPVQVIVLDAAGRYLLVNEAAAAAVGTHAAQLVGRRLADIVPPEVEAAILATDDAIRKAKTNAFSEQTLRRDGRDNYFRVVKFPVGREHGYDDAVASIVLDVTEQVTTQRRMAALARLGGLLNARSSSHAAFQAVAEAVVPEFADWCSLFERNADGSVGLVGQRHVDPNLDAVIHRMHAKYPLADDAPHSYPAVFRTGIPEYLRDAPSDLVRSIARDDEHLEILETLACASYAMLPLVVDGAVFGVLGVFTNRSSGRRLMPDVLPFLEEIADRLSIALQSDRLRQQREVAVATLEERVADRTLELARQNEALAASRVEADRANSTKSQFLARMSHEIRSPLNGVLGMATLLLESDISPDQRSMMDTLRGSAESLLTILNEILDFSKIEAGHVRLEVQPFRLATCVKDAVDLFTGIAAQKGISLTLRIDEAAPEGVLADPTRLRQVLTNLIGNAIKFTERGGVTVVVRAGEPTAQGTPLRFEVRDTGIGIADDQRERLFTPFAQGHESTTRLYGGTGLGLSISKGLVERMGGRLECESVLDEGSLFRVDLVFPKATLERPSSETAPTFDPSLGVASPLRVLLVEDNLVNQKVATRMLALFGYTADVVANGAEAVAAIQTRPYDLLFMDMHMPVLDGLEATRRIRALELAWGRPRIVAMTASSFEDDRTACAVAGMDDFIAKPVRARELEGSLRRAIAALGPSPARRPSTLPPPRAEIADVRFPRR